MINTADFNAIRLRLASPEEILKWSHGEVTKPETINYRTQRPEKDGLMDERIFGPTKDWECYCGKYRRVRYKGIVCDKCGVEVTRASVRRERFGHISLASPVSHIWFLRGVPSKLGLVLDIPAYELERVIYFAAYLVVDVNEEARAEALLELEREFNQKAKTEKGKDKKSQLKSQYTKTRDEIQSLKRHQILSELEYRRLSLKYGEVFEAETGAEAVLKAVSELDLLEVEAALVADLENAKQASRIKILKRLRLVREMSRSAVSPSWMFIRQLPVIPADLRPMVQLDGGRYASSDLNDLYRRVINRNNRLKKLQELNAPEVIQRNEKRMLQEAVDALIDNSARRGQGATATTGQRRLLRSLADMLKGKQGRFRQNLLGKRVDYSGRSVIVVGPELKLDQCGLPKRMALELFKPFVINQLLARGIVNNIRGASRLIEEGPDEVWAVLEEVIQDRYVLLNRAPTLHRLGIQAFKPILIEGMAIQIHPLVCRAFNADFDGDQMAVHLPLTEEAQAEARDLVLSTRNLLKPATGDPIVSPSQDIVLGSYWMTRMRKGAKGEGKVFASKNEAVLAYHSGVVDINAAIKVYIPPKGKKWAQKEEKFFEVSVGRILFNSALPDGYEFMNREMTASELERISSDIIERYGFASAAESLNKIKKLGFEYATLSGISWGMDDLQIPSVKSELVARAIAETEKVQEQYQQGLLTEKERHAKIVEIWTDVNSNLSKKVPGALPEYGSIHYIVTPHARASWSQVNQMSGMKGLVRNPAGEILELPIISSYKEGLKILEYFISTHGARKGTADTALKTAHAGYLTRRLVDVSQDVVVREEDCGDKEGFPVWRVDAEELGQTLGTKVSGRVAAQDVIGSEKSASGRKKHSQLLVKKGEFIDQERAELIDRSDIEKIFIRSPITCRTHEGLCGVCYGFDLGYNKPVRIGAAVGIIAAQAIGEPGTQLTMRTFHSGGVASGGDITLGLPRVEEIFEVRPPKFRAVIALEAGKVVSVAQEDKFKVVGVEADSEEKKVQEYKIPQGYGVLVEKNESVKPGQPLSEGFIDLQELFQVAGVAEAQRNIIHEIQKVYSFQGASIHDKHVEVIVRQMFARYKVKDPGDTGLTNNQLIDRLTLEELNTAVEKEGKKPALVHELLLGITKAALTTSSFLSAASFQETTRVLINAATAGRIDRLRGLKENVIIGRRVPAGTGINADYLNVRET